MATRTAFCCLSVRTGSLIILIWCLVSSLWSMLSTLTTLGNSMYKEFLNDYGYVFYLDLSIAFTGSLIYLATILSITKNTPSKSLLNTVIAFLFLGIIYSFYVTYLFTSEDVLDKILNDIIEKYRQDYPYDLRDKQFKKVVISIVRTTLLVLVTVNTIFTSYFIFVFHRYLAELKENHVAYSPAQLNVNGSKSKSNFSATSLNPQLFDQPPPYSTQTASVPHCAQQGVNQIYPTRQLQQIV